jgi:bifunctional UDP-N-acetylglucosamine pyrophosphorylase/glucosamine-1-phosphate N-acetyltransferase
MHSVNVTPSMTPADDVRLRPAYYFSTECLGPYITGLLERCTSIFELKKAMATDLAHGNAGVSDGRGVVENGALLQGEVIVQAGARIEAGARVIGPVLVCTGSVLSAGALVRDHSVIGPGCRIGFGAEITRSLLTSHVFAKHPCFVGDSVIGRRVNIGSFSSTTGLRCDRGPVAEPAIEEITVTLDGQRISTGQTKFGAVVGDEVVLPAGSVLSPGTLIGPGTVIHPRDHIGGFLPAGSRVR